MKEVYIYTLSDPIDFQIRYVGQSKNPMSRLFLHESQSRQKSSWKDRWISFLLRQNLNPMMNILEAVSSEEADDAEYRAVRKHLEDGWLLLNFQHSDARWLLRERSGFMYSRFEKTDNGFERVVSGYYTHSILLTTGSGNQNKCCGVHLNNTEASCNKEESKLLRFIEKNKIINGLNRYEDAKQFIKWI